MVALLGIDQSITFIGTDNEIKRQDIDAEVKKFGKVNMESRFDSNLNKNLARINGAILQPLKGRRKECTLSELRHLAGEIGFTGGLITDDQEEQEVIHTKIRDEETEEVSDPGTNFIRKHFPDVWFWEDMTLRTGKHRLEYQTPDTITSWIISGFSLSQDRGLAIAEPQKVTVFQDFFVKVDVPHSAKKDEVVKVEFNVYDFDVNGGLRSATTDVTIATENDEFEFVEKHNSPGKRSDCFEYAKTFQKSKRMQVSGSETGSVLIRPLKAGPIKVNVIASGAGKTDRVTKLINVENEGATQYKTQSLLFDLQKVRNKEQDVIIDIPNNVDLDSVRIEASISGNVLGSTIESVHM
jgi:Alpha-2-macroglobulin family